MSIKFLYWFQILIHMDLLMLLVKILLVTKVLNIANKSYKD